MLMSPSTRLGFFSRNNIVVLSEGVIVDLVSKREKKMHVVLPQDVKRILGKRRERRVRGKACLALPP